MNKLTSKELHLFVFYCSFYVYILVSYEEKDLKYKWRSPVESDIFIYDKEMAQFDIVSAKRYLKHKVYHSGEVNYFLSVNVRQMCEVCFLTTYFSKSDVKR